MLTVLPLRGGTTAGRGEEPSAIPVKAGYGAHNAHTGHDASPRPEGGGSPPNKDPKPPR